MENAVLLLRALRFVAPYLHTINMIVMVMVHEVGRHKASLLSFSVKMPPPHGESLKPACEEPLKRHRRHLSKEGRNVAKRRLSASNEAAVPPSRVVLPLTVAATPTYVAMLALGRRRRSRKVCSARCSEERCFAGLPHVNF